MYILVSGHGTDTTRYNWSKALFRLNHWLGISTSVPCPWMSLLQWVKKFRRRWDQLVLFPWPDPGKTDVNTDWCNPPLEVFTQEGLIACGGNVLMNDPWSNACTSGFNVKWSKESCVGAREWIFWCSTEEGSKGSWLWLKNSILVDGWYAEHRSIN